MVPFIPDLQNHKQDLVDKRNLVAIGALNEVVICTLSPPSELYKQRRPLISKSNSMPIFDWGYGLTPTMQESTLTLLAMAWDTVIQLFYIDTNENDRIVLEKDGFFFSEAEINAMHFLTDSILVVLLNQAHIKVLYTKKF